MDTDALKIKRALEMVAQLRTARAASPALVAACAEVKRFQALRFKATYSDLLGSPRYAAAANFFLQELYGDRDFSGRDQQFARIASTIARLFPQSVVHTAAALAEVHALTETLDDAMARAWITSSEEDGPDVCAKYVHAWQRAAHRAARQHQLEQVLQLGHTLDRLTRLPGLRTLLKMMRRPAAAAGLESLQQFLESGFDAFATMRGAGEFLGKVSQRESQWIDVLFSSDAVASATQLRDLLRGMHPH
jgi:hypothetical protein